MEVYSVLFENGDIKIWQPYLTVHIFTTLQSRGCSSSRCRFRHNIKFIVKCKRPECPAGQLDMARADYWTDYIAVNNTKNETQKTVIHLIFQNTSRKQIQWRRGDLMEFEDGITSRVKEIQRAGLDSAPQKWTDDADICFHCLLIAFVARKFNYFRC